MLRLRVDARSPDPLVLQQAIDALQSGEVVGCPTETFYGLAADATNPDAVERIFALKKRPRELLIPLVAADLVQVAAQVGRLTPRARRLAEAFWPGPLTLVIEALPSLVAALHGGSGRIAVRVPSHSVARALARGAGVPLTSTSANLSGRAAPTTADEVVATFSDALPLVVDSGASPGGRPSTIVDVVDEPARLVRAGAVAWEHVLEFL